MIRRVVVVLFVLVLLVAGGGYLWWRQASLPSAGATPGAAMNPLERWCADQLRRIAGDLLAPEFDFKTIKLELPAAVTLSDVSLTSNGIAFVTASSLRLEFAERPKRGQPIVIESATFVEPEVKLIERADGAWEGFSGFMKSTTGQQYDDGGSSKPSDFLAIRHIAIQNGAIEWAPQGHEHPMQFTELDMDLTTSPDEAKPGWYAFKANIDREPIIKLDWDGGISIDNGDLALDDVTLTVDLSQEDYAALTPSVQDFLRQYAIVGDLTVHATGLIPLGHADDTDLALDVNLASSSAAVGDYQFPIDSAQMKATYRQMQFNADPLTVNAFGGRIDASGYVGFADARPFSVDVKAKDVLIQNMLRPEPGKKPRKLAGRITLDANATGQRPEAGFDMNGGGTLTIAEGTLIGLPIIGALTDAIRIFQDDRGHDTGELEFTLASDRATVTKALLQGNLVAARGTGDIHYDSELDLVVNAGVLEKGESLLGPIGDVLGALTDRLLPYKVSGTWDEPVVKPAPLGLGGGAGKKR